MYYYDLKYIQELRSRCRSEGMLAPAAFWMASSEYLRACYNGVGPECWSPILRDWVSTVLAAYNTSALIHDWEYSLHAGKSYRGFTAANIRFAANACIEAVYTYCGWRRKLRIAVIGIVLAVVCEICGWRAYRGKE